jgi:hypothetical protein
LDKPFPYQMQQSQHYYFVEQNPTLFGHTAIRVSDAVLGVDVVYNYGFLILVRQILL